MVKTKLTSADPGLKFGLGKARMKWTAAFLREAFE
jgi:hypothetical protein